MSRPIGVEAHLDSRLLWRLVLMCMAVLLLAQGALSLYALRGFEDELAPQLHRKAEALGEDGTVVTVARFAGFGHLHRQLAI